jgi:uncharacterized membrane protein YhaH (DUF805 family)
MVYLLAATPPESFGLLSLIALVALAVFIVVSVVPYWIILSKAGYSGWWCLLLFVPIVNIIAPWIFALSEWPALQGRNTLSS